MTYQLRTIEALETGVYAVTFDDLDTRTSITVRCTLANYEGIHCIEVEPDIFMNGGLHIRAVIAAIAAFDHARRGDD